MRSEKGRTKKMKRILSIPLLAAILFLCLFVCGAGIKQEDEMAAATVAESDLIGKAFSTKELLNHTDDGKPLYRVIFLPDGITQIDSMGVSYYCSWFIKDDIIYTTMSANASTSFRYWNGYLVAMNDNCQGSISDGDRFEAIVSTIFVNNVNNTAEKSEQRYEFDLDGNVAYETIQDGESLGVIDMTYERDGDVITIFREIGSGEKAVV